MERWRKNLLFVVILVLLLGIASWITESAVRGVEGNIPGRDRPFAAMKAEKENTVDVLFLGDSESYSSIAPPELWMQQGMASYVCGQGAQRIQETYYILKAALQRQTPKLVVLETNVMFRDPGILENIGTSIGQTAEYYFSIFRYHNLWKQLLEGKKPDSPDYRGYRFSSEVKAYKGTEDYMEPSGKDPKIPSVVEMYMKGIRDMCAEKKIPLLMVSAPSPVNYNYEKHCALKKYAEKYNISYLDLNYRTKEMDIDWKKDTSDRGDHLNIRGARKVTAYIGEYLQNNYSLPDRRGDTKYKAWDESAEQYVRERDSVADLQESDA